MFCEHSNRQAGNLVHSYTGAPKVRKPPAPKGTGTPAKKVKKRNPWSDDESKSESDLEESEPIIPRETKSQRASGTLTVTVNIHCHPSDHHQCLNCGVRFMFSALQSINAWLMMSFICLSVISEGNSLDTKKV